jgi:Uma2 family endonuclease
MLARMSEIAIVLESPSERLLSLDEWAAMDEDEPGELIDGRLTEEEVADTPHEAVFSWLFFRLTGWAEPRRGAVFGSEVKFAVAPRRGRKPDISVFFTTNRKLPRHGPIRVPPDIMVEIVSPTPRDGRRDRVEKLREYAVFGVRWYWIVDPRLRTLEILKLGDDGHYINLLSAAEGVVNVPGCEGLMLDLDALWRRVDELVEEEPGEDPR